MLRALAKPEEAVRRPQGLDDTVLLSETDNLLRTTLAEVTPRSIAGTLDAIVSQVRQIMFGLEVDKNWSDVPPITLWNLLTLVNDMGTLTWTAGEDISANKVVYTTTNNKEVKIASKELTAGLSIVGISRDSVTSGTDFQVWKSGEVAYGFTGLQKGKLYYLASNGDISPDVPMNSGEIVVRIGIPRTTTELLIDIGDPRIRS